MEVVVDFGDETAGALEVVTCGAVVDEVDATPWRRAVAGAAELQPARTSAHPSTGAANLARSTAPRTPTAPLA
ncbi:MAG TPA: hypothetical protein VK386_02615 [Acidimicrobiales bacterium]|nr:hypothetical protein [Acidimicrobiales bacterium]